MQTMNYKEAARYLKITEGTLRNWVSQGRIKPHKIKSPPAEPRPVQARFNASLFVLTPLYTSPVILCHQQNQSQ
jgi:transposase